MLRFPTLVFVLCGLILSPQLSLGQESELLRNSDDLDLVNVAAKQVEYQGKTAINLTGTRQRGAPDVRGNRPAGEQPRVGADNQQRGAGNRPQGTRRLGGPGGMRERAESLAIVKGKNFTNGTIEVELAGRLSKAAGDNARGFIGIAFHVEKSEPIAYDCFYLRPTNGRSDDQLRRNHSCQYMSHPEYPFNRLRNEMPGVYESYVDLAPGEWTQVKIEVEGEKARLFVNGASQPCLIVNDLKRAGKGGAVALWMEQSTDAYFRNLRISEAQ